ncbi:MAG: beta-galactosidase [Verrucomicrobia bacterium]|nr:beta-galactosidase [Verrucomicrobiota bacterium]
MNLRIVAVCLLTAVTGLVFAAPLTVRVDPAGGAPRLLVNGQPVRARMFWGAPGSAPLKLTPEWKQISFEFAASGSASDGTMHFRFGSEAGDIFLDDIQVADLDAGRDLIPRCDFEAGPESFKRNWTFWPTGAANTVATTTVEPATGRNGSAGLRVRLKTPPGGHWPDFHIYHHSNLAITKDHRYRVSFWARATSARRLMLAFYQPGQHFVRLGGPPDCFGAQIKLAAEAGVNFVSYPCPMPWPKPGVEADWSGVDSACETVLRANPNALLLPRMGMNPPPWWREAHPDDVMQWEDGHRDHMVVASPRYRRDAAERLAALVTHLEEKFGDHVAGYHPCGQNTGEWFYEDTWRRPLSGYAPADATAWKEWLKKHDRPDAPVPTAIARHAAPNGIFRDPATERTLIDWAEFQQETMADCVVELARAVRQASHGRKLVVFFYGYVFEFAAVSTGPSVAGHYALRRALNCPDIDVLCSPISYFDRGLAQSAPSMTAAESVALAKKMWLNEDDTRTYLGTGNAPGWQQAVDTLEDTNKELVRNVAQEALRNFGTWWMDLGATGWFNDPGMWAEMKRLRALDEPLLKKPTPFRPQVAAVIDERAMLRVAAGGTLVTRPGIYEVRAPLGRMGASYGQYLLDDVLAGRVKAKLQVFLNAWSLSAAERTKLLKVTRGVAKVWCYAPGWFDGDQPSLEAMKQLTGFELKTVSPAKSAATPTDRGKSLGLEKSFGGEKPVKPLFAAADAKPEEILATYADGSAAVALRRMPSGPSLFVGAPGLTSELLRLAAREAGVHLFTETDCNVYANGRFLSLHASQDGPVDVNIGKTEAVTDVLSGEPVAKGPRFTLPLKRGETRVLRY